MAFHRFFFGFMRGRVVSLSAAILFIFVSRLTSAQSELTVPFGSSLVSVAGHQLLVQKRLPDGSLGPATPFLDPRRLLVSGKPRYRYLSS